MCEPRRNLQVDQNKKNITELKLPMLITVQKTQEKRAQKNAAGEEFGHPKMNNVFRMINMLTTSFVRDILHLNEK